MNDAAVFKIATRMHSLFEKLSQGKRRVAIRTRIAHLKNNAARYLWVHLGFGNNLSDGRTIQVQSLKKVHEEAESA
jgi:type II secretory pathway predicted ATPase ExeA